MENQELTQEGDALLQRILLLPNEDIRALHRLLIMVTTRRRAAERFRQTLEEVDTSGMTGDQRDCYDAYFARSIDDQRAIHLLLLQRNSAFLMERMTQAKENADAASRRIAARHPEEHEGMAARFQRKPSKRLTAALKPEKGLYDDK